MKKIITTVFIFVLLSGMAFAQELKINTNLPVPGATLANKILQSDTLKPVYSAAYLMCQNCDNFSITTTRVLKQPSNGNWKEEWVVNACGKKVYVPITFILNDYGATYMISPSDIHF